MIVISHDFLSIIVSKRPNGSKYDVSSEIVLRIKRVLNLLGRVYEILFLLDSFREGLVSVQVGHVFC